MNPNRRKNIVSFILTVLIIGAAALLAQKMSKQKESTLTDKPVKKVRRTVEVQNFTPTNATNTISVDGRLRAHERVSVGSKVQGILEETGSSLRAGRYYEKGDVLFIVDNRQASLNLNAQRSSLLSSITQLMPDLKFDYPDSFKAWDGYLRNLNPEKSIRPLPMAKNDREKYFIAGRNIYIRSIPWCVLALCLL